MVFRLEEATIDLARARAYNGVASRLVTAAGLQIAAATGATETVGASTLLPDFDRHRGRPLEFGCLEATGPLM